jgi:hypothetical protein
LSSAFAFSELLRFQTCGVGRFAAGCYDPIFDFSKVIDAVVARPAGETRRTRCTPSG